MAWGCLRHSGLLMTPPKESEFDASGDASRRSSSFGGIGRGFRVRIFLLVILVVYVGVVLLLTVTPQAVLLSATGQLWPSPFSHALVPMIAFGIILLSTAYGILSRRFLSVADVCQSLIQGIVSAAPLLLLYILVMQLVGALRFVFG